MGEKKKKRGKGKKRAQGIHYSTKTTICPKLVLLLLFVVILGCCCSCCFCCSCVLLLFFGCFYFFCLFVSFSCGYACLFGGWFLCCNFRGEER